MVKYVKPSPNTIICVIFHPFLLANPPTFGCTTAPADSQLTPSAQRSSPHTSITTIPAADPSLVKLKRRG